VQIPGTLSALVGTVPYILMFLFFQLLTLHKNVVEEFTQFVLQVIFFTANGVFGLQSTGYTIITVPPLS
jgi:hypothetical protein